VDRRLTPEDFDHLFTLFTRSAFRLETQPVYRVDVERQALDDFLRGEPKPADAYPYYRDWLQQVRETTRRRLFRRRRTIQRVRVLQEPPTDYQRFELHMARWNIAAGETLRTISRTWAAAVGLPRTDFWLFDSTHVAVMEFTPDGTPQGGSILDDPATVSQYCTWRDRAVHHSAPFTESAA
jgi:hypothetical protein